MEIISLMSRCNNKCIFCMVEDAIKTSRDMPFNDIRECINKLPAGAVVDLFGGEPTLYPFFFETLDLLREKGLRITIATNGKQFKDRDFAKKVAGYAPANIRTSIHGYNAATHDSLTRVRGSHADSLAGIRNMLELGLRVVVNYVVFNTNVTELSAATHELHEYGIRNFKYSLPIRAMNFPDLLSDLDSVRNCLVPTLDYLTSTSSTFLIEKAPFCLAPQYAGSYYMEGSPDMIRDLPRLYVKTHKCRACLLKTYCHGIENGYYSVHAESGINALDRSDLPADFIKTVTLYELLNRKIEGPPFELFHISDENVLMEEDNFQKYITLCDEARAHSRLIGII